jgi:hypothetical protein
MHISAFAIFCGNSWLGPQVSPRIISFCGTFILHTPALISLYNSGEDPQVYSRMISFWGRLHMSALFSDNSGAGPQVYPRIVGLCRALECTCQPSLFLIPGGKFTSLPRVLSRCWSFIITHASPYFLLTTLRCMHSIHELAVLVRPLECTCQPLLLLITRGQAYKSTHELSAVVERLYSTCLPL